MDDVYKILREQQRKNLKRTIGDYAIAIKTGGTHRLHTFLRILSGLILIFAFVLAVVQVFQAMSATNTFGLQSKLIDDNYAVISDSGAYEFSPFVSSYYQTWSIRGGEFGQSKNINFNLPNASLMVPNAVVGVRNTSIETFNSLVPGQSSQDNTKNIIVNGVTTLAKRQGTYFISAKEYDGSRRWYPALFLDA